MSTRQSRRLARIKAHADTADAAQLAVDSARKHGDMDLAQAYAEIAQTHRATVVRLRAKGAPESGAVTVVGDSPIALPPAEPAPARKSRKPRATATEQAA